MPRRDVLRFGALAAGGAITAGLAAGCGPGSGNGSGRSGTGTVVFLSDQLSTTQEEAAMRSQVLNGFHGRVSFTAFSDATQFVDQVVAQGQAGASHLDLIGGLQGDFVSLASQIPLRDMSDVIADLRDRHFPQQYLNLAKIKGAYRFVPWMTASYLMVANKQALPHLPAGADVNSLTYDQLLAWGQALKQATGRALVGLPASPHGLLKRFIEGYTYPSFTGALNTRFESPDAVTMWNYVKQLWAVSNPQSPTYAFMQEPLLSGEVWVAWDHAVRLIDALEQQPSEFVAFPAPRGPKGIGHLPVLAGLAIPATSKRVTEAKSLISYLTEPRTAATMLNAEAWFPSGSYKLPAGVPLGVTGEAKAIQAMTTAPDSLSGQLAVGLGAQSSAYDKVFTDTFTAIAINNQPVAATLAQQAQTLQSVLQTAGAACWLPDPASTGVCQVG
jgi:multiple sugar transport system substrate-binding protein